MSLRKLYAPALLFSLTLLFAPCVTAQTDDARAQAAAEIESLRAQIKAKESVLLAPSKEDRRAHAEFLAQPGTGIVRLLPREKWDGKLSTRGGGAYYSFTRRTHEYGHGSDIEMTGGPRSGSRARTSASWRTSATCRSKWSRSTQRRCASSPRSRPPRSKRTRARRTARSATGRREGELVYKGRLSASVGSTYVLRSVDYDNSDVLVAFRVIRKDSDGSVVLLWKMLQEFPKPTLERNFATAGGQ